MNESRRIEVERRELFFIGQNTLEKYGREQGKIEMAINLIRMGSGNNSQIAAAAEMTEERIQQLREGISIKPNPQA